MIFFDNTISKESKYKLNQNIEYLRVINYFKNQVLDFFISIVFLKS